MSDISRVETLFPGACYSRRELELVVQLMLLLNSGRLVLCQPPLIR